MSEKNLFAEYVLKPIWIALTVVTVLPIVLSDLTWLDAYREINWLMLGVQFLSIILILYFGDRLYKLHPGIMGFGIVRLFNLIIGKKREYYKNGIPKPEGSNFVTVGFDIKYFGVLLCLLIMTALPQLALWEEEIFRLGTTDWVEAFVRSSIFGLLHMLVGVPLFGAIIISGMGMIFSYTYFQGGIQLSAQVHFQYNLILFSFILLGTIITTLIPQSKIVERENSPSVVSE